MTIDSDDYVVVVSLQKCGTNLIANLMRGLGFRCIGHGIRDSYEELWARLAAFAPEDNGGRASFSHPDRMLKVLPMYPRRTCLFLHKLSVGAHLLPWCGGGGPRLFYNYRDPRDSLLSLVNYLLLKANDHYTEMPWNMIHAQVLADLETWDEQLMFAIRSMQSHTVKYRDHEWMFHHPRVINLAYEELVGPRGGGASCAQRAKVEEVAAAVGACEARAEQVVHELYDPSARTFFRGQIGGWKEAFGRRHVDEFDRKYADILATYGYGRLAATSSE